jgi:putative DNA primase/helicase
MTAVCALGDGSNDLPFDRELADWQGRIAKAAVSGRGLDEYRAALSWLKRHVPPYNGLCEKAKQEIQDAAERHLADNQGLDVIDAIYGAVFPEEVRDDVCDNNKLDAGAIKIDDKAEIKRLAGLSAVQYERERKPAAEKLGLRASILDRLVKAERPSDADGQGRAVEIADEEPWPHSVDGAELASELAKAVRTYVVMPNTAADMNAMWVMHTWVVKKFTISPRLAATSPTHGCGKTTLLRFLRHVTRRGKRVGSISPPALFRAVEQFHPTLLLDETEKYVELGSDLHALMNEGHCKGATVWRVLGENLELREFEIFGALAFARNGAMPSDLEQRSIVVSLKRRLAGEALTPLSEAQPRPHALEVLARKCARWAQDNGDRLGEIDSGEMINRAGDNWVPLFTVAEAIGGDWPARVRKAAAALAPREHDTLTVMLLADIRALEFDHEGGRDRLWSEEMVNGLVGMETRPWGELGKSRKPLTKKRLSDLLENFQISPDSVRIGDRTKKGYYRDQFEEAWQRYLGPEGSTKPEHRNSIDETGTSATFKPEQSFPRVPVQKCEKPANDGHCSGVTDCSPPLWEEEV